MPGTSSTVPASHAQTSEPLTTPAKPPSPPSLSISRVFTCETKKETVYRRYMLQKLPIVAFAPWAPSNKGMSLCQGEFNTTRLPLLRSSVCELKDLRNDGEDRERLPLPGYKWRLIISYDGTRFSGWQYQQSTPTVQCMVEEALTRITKLERKHLGLVGAGRTDAGVHAWGQVAHFITPFNYDSLDGIHKALNGLLPSDIRIREISSVVPEFHARFSVKSKIYTYKIYNDAIMDPLQRLCAYHSVYKLNAAAMREAANHFVGKHDFSAFANASRNDRTPNPVKNIFRFDVKEMGPLLQLEVEGSGFLYRQVRNMVALLVQVGREAVPTGIVPKILATCDRKELANYALSVPPHGLCLFAINYREDHLQLPSGGPTASLGRHHSISKCKLPTFY